MHRSPEELRAELEERLRFEMLLADLSARFVKVSSASIDDEIVNALRKIVEVLDLDRSVLGQLVEGGKGFVHTHTWYRPGLVPLSESAVKDLPWMASRLARGEAVCISHIDDLPEEAVKEKEVGRRFGLLSNATFPLKVGGGLIGAVSFGTMHREREWADRSSESPASLRGNDWECPRPHSRRTSYAART